MEKIVITNFKGIKGPLTLDLSSSQSIPSGALNLVLYSENGGGKTSIAEAIRLMAFHSYIENKVIPANKVDEERAAARRDWLRGYLHDQTIDTFEIELDGVKFSEITANAVKGVMVLNRAQLMPCSEIRLDQILDDTYWGRPSCRAEFLSPVEKESLMDDVNYLLKYNFREKVSLSVSQNDVNVVIIKCEDREPFSEGVNLKLNEAVQNLIKILIFLVFCKNCPQQEADKKNLLVLDDVVSSLDLANRIVLARYIVELSKCNQIVLLTHNVGFYNLMKYLVSDVKSNQQWKFASLYNIGGSHEAFPVDGIETVEQLLNRFDGRILPDDGVAINAMRKKFEQQLHELGKILTLGVQNETVELISRLVNSATMYCLVRNDKVCTTEDLVKEMESLLGACPPDKVRLKLKDLVNRYKEGNKMPWITETIKHLQAFQKVILHPGSHDHTGVLPTISTKEITMTLELMKNLETIINRGSTSYPYYM